MNNVRNHFGLPCVVAINHFTHDTAAEIELLERKMAHHEAPVVVARHWAEGGKGAEDLAREVVELIERTPADFRFVYEDEQPLWEKMRTIATRIYGAADITADSKVQAQISKLEEDGYGRYPVCVAKTQYSFSTDPALRGAPSGHVVNVREVRLAAGARVRRHGLRRHHDACPGCRRCPRPRRSIWPTTVAWWDCLDRRYSTGAARVKAAIQMATDGRPRCEALNRTAFNTIDLLLVGITAAG